MKELVAQPLPGVSPVVGVVPHDSEAPSTGDGGVGEKAENYAMTRGCEFTEKQPPSTDARPRGFLADLRSWRRLRFSGAAARKGTLALMDQAVVSGTNFMTTIMVGRICGAEKLGHYALGLTFVSLITCAQESLITTPYTIYGNRLQGKERTRYAGSVLVHYAVLALMAVFVLAGAATLFSASVGFSSLAQVLWVLAIVVPFILVREFSRRFALAHLHVAQALGIDAAVAVVQIGSLALLASAGLLSAATAYAAMGGGCAVAGLAWLVFGQRDFVFRWRQVGRDWRKNWSFGRWVFAEQMTASMRHAAVPWMVAFTLGQTATGMFAAAQAVVRLSNPFVRGVGNVLGPKVARSFAFGGTTELRRIVGGATLLLGGVMAVFCSLAFLLGGVMLKWLYGAEYTGQGATVGVLALAAMASAMAHAPGYGLLAVERSDVNFKVRVLSLLVTVIAAGCLMNSLGVLGAAYGLLAGATVAVAAIYFIYRSVVGGLSLEVGAGNA